MNDKHGLIVNIVEFVLVLSVVTILQMLAIRYAPQYEIFPGIIFGVFYGNRIMKWFTSWFDKNVLVKYQD